MDPLGWLAGRVQATDRARGSGRALPSPTRPSLHLAASLCFLQRISCSPLSAVLVSSVRRGERAQDEQRGRDRAPTGGRAQTLSCQPPGSSAAGRVTDSLTRATLGCCVTRRRAPVRTARARASCAHGARVCRRGAGAARSAGAPRSPPHPPAAAPAQVLSRPLACRPVVSSAAHSRAGVCGRQSSPRPGRGGAGSGAFPSSRHLWTPNLWQVVQRTAPRLLGHCQPSRSLPHHRNPVPLLAALLCALVGLKPLLRPPPQTKLNRPWNRRPLLTFGRRLPLALSDPQRWSWLVGRGLQSPSGGES